MKSEKSLVIALVGALYLLLSCSAGWAWQTNISFAWANAVAVDAAGNVVAAGCIETAAGCDFTVVKFDGVSGQELWRRVINGTANSSGWANKVAMDAAGNVVAAGATNGMCVDYDCYVYISNFTVIKFDGTTGAELWRKDINDSGGNSANALAIDGAGNVVAAGTTNGNCVDSNCDTYVSNFTVVKFDGATGAELWRKDISGNNYANAVAVDAAGNVVAAGSTVNSGTFGDFTVVKLDGVNGQELWRQSINGTANSYDWANAVTVDAAGNVVAAGATENTGTSNDFTVVKFDGVSGQELWRRVINGTRSSYDYVNAVAVDAAGNVVAAGHTHNTSTFNDFTVVKLDGVSGAELWRQVINGTANGADYANAVAVDAVGNVVAAGVTDNANTFNDFTVVKFDGASGQELWRQVINGTANGYDWANAVAVDAAGNVVAAGNTGSDFTVVKFGTGIPTKLLGLTADLASPQNLGTTITFTATANGGLEPLQYKWWVFNGVAWTVVKDWSTSNSFSWSPGLGGNYRVGVWVKSSGNPADAPENNAYSNIAFNIIGLTVTALTANKTSPQPEGASITFTATAADGTPPLQYKWWVFNGVIWSVVKDWSTSNSFSWTPGLSGNYRVGVWVKSSGNPADAPENNAYSNIAFNIIGLTVTALTANKTSPQPEGASITFTATAADGTPPLQYKWWVFNGVAWTVVKDWSTSNSFSWTPGLGGNYRVGVWVKSSGKPDDAPENNAYAAVDFTIGLVITGLSPDQASPQPAGTTINFTATTSGGLAPIQYKWWVFNGVAWTVVKDWSTSNSFSWTPGLGGNYRVGFWAKSSGNSADEPENNAYTAIDFNIIAPPGLMITGLSPGQASPQPAGTTINFTATTTGGLAPIQYKWWVFNGVAWTVVKDWSTSNSFSWTPGLGGNYKVGFWAKSNLNPADAPENNAYTAIDFTIVSGPPI